MVRVRQTGEGALYKIRDGKLWRGVVDLGRDPFTGKRVQKVVTARTQRAARAKLREIQDEVEQYGAPLERTILVKDWAEKWLDIARRSHDPNSFITARTALTVWILPEIGRRHLKSLTAADVRKIHNNIMDAGRSAASSRRYIGTLSLMLEEARRQKLIRHNPCEDFKTSKNDEVAISSRGAFTTEEGAAILLAAARLPNAEGSRWWFKLLAGQRQGEIVGAVLEDLHLDKGMYQVNWKLEEVVHDHGCGGTCRFKRAGSCPQRKPRFPDNFDYRYLVRRWYLTPPKSRRGRWVPLVPQLVTAIERYLEATKDWPNPHGLIWRNQDGSPIELKQDADEWRDLLHKAGVITAEENKPGGTAKTGHWARHTTITVLAQLGVDFQLIGEIVGHSSTEVTQIYRHAQAEEKQAAMRKVSSVWAESLVLPTHLENKPSNRTSASEGS